LNETPTREEALSAENQPVEKEVPMPRPMAQENALNVPQETQIEGPSGIAATSEFKFCNFY
jgi:hypothetical protein